MQYRPEVDGLRAIAIVPVVLYHAGLATLSGGFTGVDIFFVISGYLISTIIFEEVATGTFTYRRFYERRIRRILPALLVVILATMVGASVVALPDQLAGTARSAIAALLSVSNIWFWLQSGYFAPSAAFMPLLHTWSLGVEEQFYLVLPVLIMLMVRLRAPIRLVLLLLAVPAFAGSLWLSQAKPSVAFYLLPSRAWELGLGVMLGAGVFPRFHTRAAGEVAAAAGLALIAIGLFWIHEGMMFPGWVALLPCVGTALVIHGTMTPGANVVRALLSVRPMVFVGLISYSLYLWHWPVLTLMRLQTANVDLSAAQAGVGVLLSIVLATATWRYVEQPFRRRMPTREVAMVVTSGAVVASTMAVALIVSDGFPGRLGEDARRMYMAAKDIDPFTEICVDGLAKPECEFGEGDGPVRFLLVGDSHAAALRPVFDGAVPGLTGRGMLLWRGACPFLDGAWTQRGSASGPECRDHNASVMEEVRSSPEVDLVILAGRWDFQMTGIETISGGSFRDNLVDDETTEPSPAETLRVFERALGRTLDELGRLGKHVIVVGAVPGAGFDVPSILALGILNGTGEYSSEFRADTRKFIDMDNVFMRVISVRPHVRYVPVWDVLCSESCPAMIEGVPIYFDKQHLTARGALEILGPRLAPRLEHALLR